MLFLKSIGVGLYRFGADRRQFWGEFWRFFVIFGHFWPIFGHFWPFPTFEDLNFSWRRADFMPGWCSNGPAMVLKSIGSDWTGLEPIGGSSGASFGDFLVIFGHFWPF